MPENDWSWIPSGSTLDSSPVKNLPPFMSNPKGGTGLPQGGGGWASGVDWGGVAGLAAPIIASFFGGSGPDISKPISEIQGNARALGQTGKDLTAQGMESLGPAQAYFAQLLSGNPADVMSATAPERRRVIDQYDTARRSAAQFTPRGGGQASTQQESRSREAGDLATLGADARRGAAGAAASIGLSETQAGLSAQERSTQQLAQMLEPLFKQQQQNQNSFLSTITGVAQLAAMFI